MKNIWILLLLFFSSIAGACSTDNFLEDIACDMDFFAYAGYQYVGSTAGQSIKSAPLAGVSANYNPYEWLGVTLAINLEDTYTLEHFLTFAFISLRHQFDENWGIKFRGGRLKNQFGLYNEVLKNPLLRPTIISPQSIYVESLRTMYQSSDGVSLSLLYNDFEIGYSIGAPNLLDPQEATFFLTNMSQPTLTNNFGDFQNFFFNWRSNDTYWTVKGNYDIVRMSPGGNGPLSVGDLNYTQLGVEYKGEKWMVSIEGMLLHTPQQSLLNNFKDVTKAFSIIVGYDINNWWHVYANYNQAIVTSRLERPIPQPASKNSVFSRDISIGSKFYWNQFVLGLEVHAVEGAAFLPYSEQISHNNSQWIYGAAQLFYYWD